MLGKKLVVFGLVLCMFIGILPGVHGAQAGPVDIFEFDGYEKSVGPDSSVTYDWVFYNGNGTESFLVSMEITKNADDWDVSLSENYFVIGPEEYHNLTLVVASPTTFSPFTMVTEIDVTVTNLRTLQTETTTLVTDTVLDAGLDTTDKNKVLGMFDNPLPAPLNSQYGVFLLTVLIWVIIALIIFFVLDPVVKSFTEKTETLVDDMVLAIVRGPILAIIISYGAVSSLYVLELDEGIIVTLDRAWHVLLILMITWMTYKIFKNVLIYYGKTYAEKTESDIDDVLIPVFEKIGAVVIVIFGIISILRYMGIDITVFIAGMGVMGLVIAFAAQDTLSNFFSGMFLLTDRPFKVGDLIILDTGEVCEVKKIGMRTTTLYNTFDHDLIIMPNNKIANDKIINIVQPDTKFKIKINVGVAYGSDVQKVKGILEEIALDHRYILKEGSHKPLIRFTNFGESSLDFIIILWVNEVTNQWVTASDIREEIDRRFREEGIQIPFPQRDVHVFESEMQASEKIPKKTTRGLGPVPVHKNGRRETPED